MSVIEDRGIGNQMDFLFPGSYSNCLECGEKVMLSEAVLFNKCWFHPGKCLKKYKRKNLERILKYGD